MLASAGTSPFLWGDMYYEIQSIEELDDGHTRTVVYFWADRASYLRDTKKTNPLLAEDFISNVQPTVTRIVTNEKGHWQRADGTFVDPTTIDPQQQYMFEREEFDIDVRAVLLENIERFLARENADGTTNADRILSGELRGDRTSKQLELRQVSSDRRAAFLNDQRIRDVIHAPREARTRGREVRR